MSGSVGFTAPISVGSYTPTVNMATALSGNVPTDPSDRSFICGYVGGSCAVGSAFSFSVNKSFYPSFTVAEPTPPAVLKITSFEPNKGRSPSCDSWMPTSLKVMYCPILPNATGVVLTSTAENATSCKIKLDTNVVLQTQNCSNPVSCPLQWSVTTDRTEQYFLVCNN